MIFFFYLFFFFAVLFRLNTVAYLHQSRDHNSCISISSSLMPSQKTSLSWRLYMVRGGRWKTLRILPKTLREKRVRALPRFSRVSESEYQHRLRELKCGIRCCCFDLGFIATGGYCVFVYAAESARVKYQRGRCLPRRMFSFCNCAHSRRVNAPTRKKKQRVSVARAESRGSSNVFFSEGKLRV